MNLIWITKAKYLKDYKVLLTFNNGIKGEVDLKEKINKLSVFKSLKDKSIFKNFKLNSWTLEWENEIDIAPESLYKITLKQNNDLLKSSI